MAAKSPDLQAHQQEDEKRFLERQRAMYGRLQANAIRTRRRARPSEVAMELAEYQRDIEAIDRILAKHYKGRDGNRV